MDFESLFSRHASTLEDFWGRRDNGMRHAREFYVFGRRIRLASNTPDVLQAADHSKPRYSRAEPDGAPPFKIEIAAPHTMGGVGPPPEDLFDRIQYTGHGSWVALRLGGWGHAHVDLAAGQAAAVVAPELASQPEIVSQCLLDTVILNLFIAEGFGMLHASCLVWNSQAVLLLAPHNAGKSTTALRLALAGYRLVSDSMVFIPPGDTVRLLGFPVGEVKLRADAAAEFVIDRPELRDVMRQEWVRGEVKYRVHADQLHPSAVEPDAIEPAGIDLCFLTRGDSTQTQITPSSRAEIADAAMRNSLYYDTRTVCTPPEVGLGSGRFGGGSHGTRSSTGERCPPTAVRRAIAMLIAP
jgi:hypothetical protein